MNFLLDENLSPKVCEDLRAAGHEAIHVRDVGLAGSTDHAVLTHAAEFLQILVTADRGDFGRELAQTRATAPSVVLLRQLPDVVRAHDVSALLLANLLPHIASALSSGAFVVLTPRAVRVRHLPLR